MAETVAVMAWVAAVVWVREVAAMEVVENVLRGGPARRKMLCEHANAVTLNDAISSKHMLNINGATLIPNYAHSSLSIMLG